MQHDEENFTLIYTSTKPLEIAAAVSMLEEQDIPAFTINKTDSSYIFGVIELYVSNEQVDKAQLILTENNLL